MIETLSPACVTPRISPLLTLHHFELVCRPVLQVFPDLCVGDSRKSRIKRMMQTSKLSRLEQLDQTFHQIDSSSRLDRRVVDVCTEWRRENEMVEQGQSGDQ